MVSLWIRRLGLIIVITALGAMVGGCVSDSQAAAPKKKSPGQMRYYGGPKFPMWRG